MNEQKCGVFQTRELSEETLERGDVEIVDLVGDWVANLIRNLES